METIERTKQYTFILGSKSPRRKDIFKALDLNVVFKHIDVHETYPEHLKGAKIPEHICKLKSDAYHHPIEETEVLVTADTIVWINDHILEKPKDLAHAKLMLKELSGTSHQVHTAVCLRNSSITKVFSESTVVHFHTLSDLEIAKYVDKYAPLDKAGAYGIQEFIGYIGIKAVEGDFYNVVGFPVQRFWRELGKML